MKLKTIVAKMPSTADNKAKTSLPTQAEKPIHYQYLKEFRVEQCQLFLQHKCTQHKPFTCFYWHFMNQRRRKPTRKRDGTFNYSPDNYCSKYDETTGVCPDGDECQLLHRTAGDTERRYHLKYYKTDICVYDTDSRGYCVKNGPHCAFAHGIHDIRNHVYDIRELQGMESGGLCQDNNNTNEPNSLDKERYALNDDPRWQDTSYVLANYKTELCKRPPRLCRQGYACPQYHNNKDKRRSPKKYKYRSTPCPNVKQGDEWGDPVNCETGDTCAYCHTRTEQQFHPEIYKSTKCNDMQQTGYCPRGPFCAFAHVEKEISATRDLNMDCSNDISTLLTHALSPTTAVTTSSSVTGPTIVQGASGINETVVVNSNTLTQQAMNAVNSMPNELNTNIGVNTNGPENNLLSSQSHAQQQQQQQTKQDSFLNSPIPNFDFARQAFFKREDTSPNMNTTPGPGPIARPRAQSTNSHSTFCPTENLVTPFQCKGPSSYDEKNFSNSFLTRHLFNDLAFRHENTTGLTNINNNNHINSYNNNNGSSSFQFGSYASTAESTIESVMQPYDDGDLFNEYDINDFNGISPSSNINGGSTGNNLNASTTAPVNIPGARVNIGNISSRDSPSVGSLGMSPFPAYLQIPPLSSSAQNDSNATNVVQPVTYFPQKNFKEDFSLNQACENLKREADEANRIKKLAEKQRDEALMKMESLQQELHNLKSSPYSQLSRRIGEFEKLPLPQLKQLEQQLKTNLDCIEKIISNKASTNSTSN